MLVVEKGGAFYFCIKSFISIGVAIMSQFSGLRAQILIHSSVKLKMGKFRLARPMQMGNYNLVLAI